MLNALSVDVEEWYHAELIRNHVVAGGARSQVREATRPILDLLARYSVRATFFVVGEIAENVPELVRQIAKAGHEIGCHGMSHLPLQKLDPDALRSELMRYVQAMSVLDAKDIVGFRAPTFSLDNRTRWAVPVLREFNYQYDSSIFPVRNYLYGVSDCPPAPYRLGDSDVTRADPQGTLWEFPLSTWRMGKWKVPVSGGFYLRAAPTALLKMLLARINARGWPFVIYLHPWETFAETPRLRRLPWLSRLVTYANLESALSKLEQLLQTFSFTTVRQALAHWREEHPTGA